MGHVGEAIHDLTGVGAGPSLLALYGTAEEYALLLRVTSNSGVIGCCVLRGIWVFKVYGGFLWLEM